MNPVTQPDDLEAVRTIVKAIEPFQEDKDRKRILRWAAEKLSLPEPFAVGGELAARGYEAGGAAPTTDSSASTATLGGAADVRSFIESKMPTSDVQFAAAVAYFYQFVAREAERRNAIDKDMLRDAFRRAGRKQPKDCGFTLVNAMNAGLLDHKDQGNYSINTVGENLVAMTLPPRGSEASGNGRKKAPKRSGAAKSSSRVGTRNAR